MSESALQLQDMIHGIVERERRQQVETMERMLRDDLRLIGIDVEHILAAERMPDRITVAQQVTPDGGYLYRGLVLDNDLVIDHCWQHPFTDDVIRRRLIGFVYAGSEAGRMHFARQYTLDQRVVLRAEPERLRGMRSRLIYVASGEPNQSVHTRDNWYQAQRLVELLNRSNGWPAVNPYGD